MFFCILSYCSKLYREVQPLNWKYSTVQMLLNRPAQFSETVQPCNWKYGTVQMHLNRPARFKPTIQPCNWKYGEVHICVRWFGLLENKTKKQIFSHGKMNRVFLIIFNKCRRVLGVEQKWGTTCAIPVGTWLLRYKLQSSTKDEEVLGWLFRVCNIGPTRLNPILAVRLKIHRILILPASNW